MEFQLEGILETVLVGTIASLVLLSILFLVFGHRFRVELIQRIAQFALYEQRFVRVQKDHAESRESNLSFAILLLVALLYGLGATVESITHDSTNDKDIKAAAFQKVGRGQVEGRTTPLSFARFVTDDLACRAIGFEDPEPQANKNVDSPCLQIFRQEKEFYYEAKSSVFQKESFAGELTVLQGRIDFVRSAGYAIAALCLVTLIAAALGFISEYLVPDREFDPLQKTTWFQHLKELAAIRCLVIAIILAGLACACYVAWEKVETQYDHRVFGYLLSLVKGGSAEEPDPQAVNDDHSTASTSAFRPTGSNDIFPTNEHQEGPNDVVVRPLPSSPYRIFSAPWGGRFEPSAIQPLGNDHFIVANDRGGATPFLLFKSSATGLRSLAELAYSAPKPSSKFEALHSYVSSDGQHLLAIESDTADKDTPLTVIDLSLDANHAVTRSVNRKLANPCRSVAEKTRDSVATSCFIEGMTLRNRLAPDTGKIDRDGYLLLAVRHLQRPGENHRPMVVIVVLEKAGDDSWQNPQVVFQLPPDPRDPCAPFAGISDVEVLDDTHLLFLTSVELQPKEHCVGAHANPVPVAQVQGALWSVQQSAAGQATNPRHLHRFSHKPEGLTLLRDGTVLIIFDDDGKRKSLSRAPDTFPLEQNQSVYTIVQVD